MNLLKMIPFTLLFGLLSLTAKAQNIPQPSKGCFIMFEDTGFRKNWLEICIDEYQAGKVHSFKHSGLSDKLSSIAWNLPTGCVVYLFDHIDGSGRSYSLQGKGSDYDTHNDNFADCATTFSFRCN